MFCKNCGQKIDDLAAVCVHCGVATNVGNKFCKNCGAAIADPNAAICTGCGCPIANTVKVTNQKSKLAAGLLGIFLGGYGVHNFYLGFTKRALVQLLVSLLTCGVGAPFMGIWGLIEGIFYLTGKYNVDANGNPLAD